MSEEKKSDLGTIEEEIKAKEPEMVSQSEVDRRVNKFVIQNKELADWNKNLEEKVNQRTWALKYQNKALTRANQHLEKSLMETIRLLLSLVESSNPVLGNT